MRTSAARVVAAVCVTAVATLGMSTAAHAATGDTWSGYQVVHVQPAATTQKVLLGLMPHYTGGGKNLYLWNAVRMVTDSHGHESWVFCIQQAQGGSGPTYTEDPNVAGTPDARANMTRINRVLADTTLTAPGALQATSPDPALVNPAVDVLPQNRNDHLEITAVQLAIWHYSDNFDFTVGNTSIAKQFYPASFAGTGNDLTISDIITRYDALVADADANPLTNPVPSITVTPETASAVAGTPVTFTVKGTDIDGSIALTSSNSSVAIHPAGSGGACDTAATLTSLPAEGAKVCVVSDSVTSVKITASGASSPTTTHALFADDSQAIIATGPDRAGADGTATWTAVAPIKKPATKPPVAVLGEKTSATPVTEELAATGPAAIRLQAGAGVLAMTLGVLLLLATRRRETEPVLALVGGGTAPQPAYPGRALAAVLLRSFGRSRAAPAEPPRARPSPPWRRRT